MQKSNKDKEKKPFSWDDNSKDDAEPIDKLKLKGKNKSEKIDELVKAIRLILSEDNE